MLRIDRVSPALVRMTIDRPPANALTLDLIQALADALVRFGEEAEAPAVILTGAGQRFFSAGGDIREIETQADIALPRMRVFHHLLTVLENYRCPLLCAVKDNNAPVQLIGDGHIPDEKDSKLYQVS